MFKGMGLFIHLYHHYKRHSSRNGRGHDSRTILMALRRFIARRGKPEMIISDNAPQFKVADTALEKAWQKILRHAEVKSYVSEQGITWLFIKELH